MSDPVKLTPERLRAMALPQPEQGGDKDGRGRVLIVAGSRAVPGAAILAAEAALRAGAGKLQVATVAGAATGLGLAMPEAMVTGLPETDGGEIAASGAEQLAHAADRCDGLLIGPGMMDENAAGALTAALLAHRPRRGTVIDAAALYALKAGKAGFEPHRDRLVITPHAGEIASLLGRKKADIEADPLAAAREASARLSCVTVMKGGRSFIVGPNGDAFVNVHGHVGLATSGSGDTLAGLITGLLARGASPMEASAWGVFVHAAAGGRLARAYGGIGFLARELPKAFAEVLGELSPLADAPA